MTFPSNFISCEGFLGRNLKTKKRHHAILVGKKIRFYSRGWEWALFLLGVIFHPRSSPSLQTLKALQPLHTDIKDRVFESRLYLNFASIAMCFHFLWRLAKRLFLGFHFVCSELPDDARSRLGWAVPSGCPDGKNLTIAFSARGLILSSFFTTWACQDRVYPQKWIAYLLHNISQSIWIIKGKVFCFFPICHKLG